VSAPTPNEPPRRYRPPLGIPSRQRRGVGGLVASVLLHALLILLVIVPFSHPELVRAVLGAGGAGPAGGGGGGNRGSGGKPKTERLEYVRVASPPPPPPLTRLRRPTAPRPEPSPPPERPPPHRTPLRGHPT